MADSKISALTAASAVAGTNEFAINEAGTSKKVTAAQIAAYTAPTLIAGNSGTANSSSAPCETWQILTSNATANSTTTLATVMTTSSLPTGTYFYEYYIVWQSSNTGNGITFAVDYSGTVTRTRMTRHLQTTGAAAATGVADGAATTLTGQLVEHMSARADAGLLGPNTGVDTINVDQFDVIRGLLVVSTSANLLLQAASEAAVSVQVMADTCLFLKRLA